VVTQRSPIMPEEGVLGMGSNYAMLYCAIDLKRKGRRRRLRLEWQGFEKLVWHRWIMCPIRGTTKLNELNNKSCRIRV